MSSAGSDSKFQYPGHELEIFRHATRWKTYWMSRVGPYLSGDVLEVGAGLGANTAQLIHDRVTSWHCLEPDSRLMEDLHRSIAGLGNCTASQGTIQSIAGRGFDAILYADVLEHIEDDRGELSRAARLLRPGGRLVVLSPAHQGLFTGFDQAIGHLRRYSRASLIACGPDTCRLTRTFYLDSAGIAALLGNKLLLHQALPRAGQIWLWDRCMVPVSRLLDPLTGYRVGKTIIAVWTRNGQGRASR